MVTMRFTDFERMVKAVVHLRAGLSMLLTATRCLDRSDLSKEIEGLIDRATEITGRIEAATTSRRKELTDGQGDDR